MSKCFNIILFFRVGCLTLDIQVEAFWAVWKEGNTDLGEVPSANEMPGNISGSFSINHSTDVMPRHSGSL